MKTHSHPATQNAKATRRHLSAEDKVKLLRLHLLEDKPISEICDYKTRLKSAAGAPGGVVV